MKEFNINNNQSIQSMYDKVMQGFVEDGVEIVFNNNELNCESALYAPGYEQIGVSDVVAKSIIM